MEFVLVTFPTLRPVRMDGARQGQTGQIIGVQRGTHIFDLGSPQDYAPPRVQTVVANTSQMQPLVIFFQPSALPVVVGGPPPEVPASVAAAPTQPTPVSRTRASKAAGRKRSGGGVTAALKGESTRKRASLEGATTKNRRSQSKLRGGTRKSR
jgi:hypothetical protein